jgi:hypothetical protein
VLLATVLPATAQEDKAYKVVDPRELGIGSKKYMGKNLEVHNFHCYYADVKDYPCIFPGVFVAIFTKNIDPANLRTKVEDDCDNFEKAFSTSKCSFTIRFSYDEDDVTEDVVSGYQKRTVIGLSDVELIQPAAGGNNNRGRRRR